ncbi:MAG: transcription antitermination factor NusB [Nitrospirae bacterium]|nr:transcription antitermination factor NusB [Nitrospirota bacterium]
MNRRKAREFALQMLFQYEFTGHRSDFRAVEDLDPAKKEHKDIKQFSEELVSGTLEHLDEIDERIRQAAEHWKMDRMASVDRNIMRFAVFELLYRNDIPPKVTINESLEIAKKFSSSEAASFINGLLDKIARESRKKS